MPRHAIRTYHPPELPRANGSTEAQLKQLQEWAVKMNQWAQDTQASLQDFFKRSGLT